MSARKPKAEQFELEELIGDVRDHCTILDTLIDSFTDCGWRVKPKQGLDSWVYLQTSEEDINALVHASILMKEASRALYEAFHAAASARS